MNTLTIEKEQLIKTMEYTIEKDIMNNSKTIAQIELEVEKQQQEIIKYTNSAIGTGVYSNPNDRAYEELAEKISLSKKEKDLCYLKELEWDNKKKILKEMEVILETSQKSLTEYNDFITKSAN